MIYLRNLFSIITFVFLLFIELLLNTIFNFDYFLIMPFFIGMFIISTLRFSNYYISIFLVAGIYYDTLYSSNILGFSSAKFLITIIFMNFIIANQQNNTYLDLATFTVGIYIYKFTYSWEYLNPEFLYQLLVSSLVNYFLFRILNITIGKNVLKQKI
tara:strand:- start:982 stop:1452 length:471 start_codon:yes stop_codon:yes gene_type:complete